MTVCYTGLRALTFKIKSSFVYVQLPYISFGVLVSLHWWFQYLTRISWILRITSSVLKQAPKTTSMEDVKVEFVVFKRNAEINVHYSWHQYFMLPWGACSGRHESPPDWWSVRAGDLHIRTFWKAKVNAEKRWWFIIRLSGTVKSSRKTNPALTGRWDFQTHRCSQTGSDAGRAHRGRLLQHEDRQALEEKTQYVYCSHAFDTNITLWIC